MRLTRLFPQVRFGTEVLRAAMKTLQNVTARNVQTSVNRVASAEGEWQFDNDDEFFGEIRSSKEAGYMVCLLAPFARADPTQTGECQITVEYDRILAESRVTVQAPSRVAVFQLMRTFDDAVDGSRLPSVPAQRPVIFIGHGRNTQWRDLKDHLTDKHGYDVQAFEVGARAGHGIRDILEQLLERSTFAILVMTGEDEQEDGALRARQNVVHEAGLFQGRLGFSRAICAVEDSCEVFSNNAGIIQLRFAPGHIQEIFGDVVATLRREFGPP